MEIKEISNYNQQYCLLLLETCVIINRTAAVVYSQFHRQCGNFVPFVERFQQSLNSRFTAVICHRYGR